MWEDIDAGLLVEAINRIASDPGAAAALRAAGRKHYEEQFHPRHIRSQFQSLIAEMEEIET